ncbi:MAG: arsenate reductase (glutaredoxin) [Proteobacteria bacterium]|nr:arsenate reductase (glutaredoxin) [Pseudomonadota bacterium]
MTVRIYHNPRCSKSRQALDIIRKKGIEPEIVDYLKNPLKAAEIEKIIEALKCAPRGIMRVKEDEYAANDLGNPLKKDRDLIAAIVRHPILMERPIVITGKGAVIARPPEKAREVL